jgi:hypothetical protein
MEGLQRQIKQLDDSYGEEYLSLMMARAYCATLISNARVRRFLNQRYGELSKELESLVEAISAESCSMSQSNRGASAS